MSLFEILSTLLIGPLKLIFEIITAFAYKLTGHVGLSVVVLSLVMNFLLLPLYRRTDLIQEEARDVEEKLREGVDHIKKSFSGDERMMILQTYYRQNNYKPTDALNGSVSLLLEVPFFMAAYQFLSNLQMLEGIPFGPIADLSAPDALFAIGGFTVNLLPVIMTVVNFISSALYLKGFPLKTKIQLYAMALFFLVFLYESPSGLVLYWTMNNLFSLGKTLFYKLKNPRAVAAAGICVAGIGLGYYAAFLYEGGSMKVRTLAIAMAAVMQLPLLGAVLARKLHWNMPRIEAKPNGKIFLLGTLFLTVLVGLLIPSTFIAASAQEFVDITCFHNPLWYCAASTCLAAGTFLVWMGVFYWLANDTGKAVFDKLVWILCGVMTVNYMFFGTDLGIISANLQYESGMIFSKMQMLVNLAVLLAVALCLLGIARKWSKAVTTVLLTAVIALGSMSGMNLLKIDASLENLEQLADVRNQSAPHFELSKTGKNVVVIMLDRAMGAYVPYLMEEKPQLQEQFDGFTYYSNTISFGGYTNFGTPALFGGYEYTPVEMNKRDKEPLVEKQNEALKVMPVIFSEEGYNVTVCDPTYANYQWISDLSIYRDYPGINTYITDGRFGDIQQKQVKIQNLHRNFFCFSIMKTMPLFAQPAIYNAGVYNQVDSLAKQVRFNTAMAKGLDAAFMDSFGVLQNLPELTRITDGEENTFLLMSNDTTHESMLLQAPDYLPAETVDNREYDAAHTDRFTVGGRTIRMEDGIQMSQYHLGMAAFIQLGNWFDYLKENGVYDNTRIILVSDHGRDLYQLEELVVTDDMGALRDVAHYFPLLMVKDFGSSGFTTSVEFMTNADVPVLAMDQLIRDPVNPFTGKPVTNEEKYAHEQIIIVSEDWNTQTNNGNTFLPAAWASVKENIWNKDNWSFHKEETVLTEHKLP